MVSPQSESSRPARESAGAESTTRAERTATRKQIVLAGNPNSGKTALFNALTGLRYKVANYPGVTVEKKEGPLLLPTLGEATAVDLPGAYSLDSHSLDEQIATKILLSESALDATPDIIVAVVDSTNIERNLFFTSQLIDLGVPLVVALSMRDLADAQGITVRAELLSRELGVPVVAVSSHLKTGIQTLLTTVEHVLQNGIGLEHRPMRWLPDDSPLRHSAAALSAELQKRGGTRYPILVSLGLLSDARSADSWIRPLLAAQRTSLEAQDVDPYSAEATLRYQWIHAVCARAVSVETPDKVQWAKHLDAILLHRVYGLFVFLGAMGLIFQAIFFWSAMPMEWIDGAVAHLGQWVASVMPKGELESLITDGVIAGVGSVLVFVPQIAILFFFIGILEDSGYLARAAYVTDRVMRKFGLQGRSFVPLLSSFACAVPGILSTRTIPTFADRLVTILIAPFMSCSARLPVYALLIAAFVPPVALLGMISLQGLTLLIMYLLGVIGALLVARILKSTLIRGKPAPFVMELPQMRRPSMRLVLRGVFDRVLIFVKSAGTVILACSVILWFLSTHPAGDPHQSYAGQLGALIEPALRPLQLPWEVGVAIIASFAAREVFVSALATVYNVADNTDSPQSLLDLLRHLHASGKFSLASAMALMVFYVFACQCMSTLAVVRRETGSWWWVGFMFSYMTGLAYLAALATYQIVLML